MLDAVRTSPRDLLAGRQRAVAMKRLSVLVAGTLCHAPDWPLLCDALGFPGDAPWLQRVTVACDALADRAFSAATLVGQLRRALASELWTPRRSSFPV